MTTRNYKTIDEAFKEMNFCITLSKDETLRGLDRKRNAECYVFARDSAMVLGADISNYPRSIGETESQFSQSKLSEILGRMF